MNDDASAIAASGNAVVPETYPYIWSWRAKPADRDRKGERCRVICRGTMNSALVEFEDGRKFVTSRNGLRKQKP